jgi:hypothetical protein
MMHHTTLRSQCVFPHDPDTIALLTYHALALLLARDNHAGTYTYLPLTLPPHNPHSLLLTVYTAQPLPYLVLPTHPITLSIRRSLYDKLI